MNMTKNKRDKQTLAADVAFVLNSVLHLETKKAVLNNALWKWTEHNGKYKGCKFWTMAALEHFNREGNKQGLRHEHVVPRKYLIVMLLRQNLPISTSTVFDLFERFAIGAVVTEEEEKELNKQHKSDMPSEFEERDKEGYQDAWLRFKKIPLEVFDSQSLNGL